MKQVVSREDNFPLTGWQKWVRFVSLTVAVVLAAVLVLCRLRALGEALIYDEVYSWVTAQAQYPLGTVLKEVLWQDVNLPLYNLLLRGWAWLVPTQTGWFRLLSVLCSLGTLGIIWGLSPKSWPRLYKGTWCLLVAGSFALTEHAHVLRTYPLSVLLVTLCTVLALRLAENLQTRQTAPRWQWITFFGAGLCCAYTHHFAACIFFSTALFLFLVACKYRQARSLIFLATAGVFAVWGVWVVHTLQLVMAPQTDWWFHTSKVQASWEILEYNLGTSRLAGLAGVLLCVGSLNMFVKPGPVVTHKTDLALAAFQLVCLLVSVGVVSLRHNLWLSRYFLIALPSFFLLLTGLLWHLLRRWPVTWVLLPVWIAGQAWQYSFFTPTVGDPSGFQTLFDYVSRLGYKRVLVLKERVSYPGPAVDWVLQYYMPKEHPLEIVALTPQNVNRMKAPEYLPLVMPLSGFISVMKLSLEYPYNINSARKLVGHTSLLQDPVFRFAPAPDAAQPGALNSAEI